MAEFELDDGSLLKHSYVQTEAGPAFHIKATLVNQVHCCSCARCARWAAGGAPMCCRWRRLPVARQAAAGAWE